MGGGSPDRHGSMPTTASPPTRRHDGHAGSEAHGGSHRRRLAFIEEQAAAQRPFFAQFSYYAVHTPVLAMPETIDRFRQMDSRRHTNTAYAAMTEELDAGVGRISTGSTIWHR